MVLFYIIVADYCLVACHGMQLDIYLPPFWNNMLLPSLRLSGYFTVRSSLFPLSLVLLTSFQPSLLFCPQAGSRTRAWRTYTLSETSLGMRHTLSRQYYGRKFPYVELDLHNGEFAPHHVFNLISRMTISIPICVQRDLRDGDFASHRMFNLFSWMVILFPIVCSTWSQERQVWFPS
jgi:hypothetical protein